MTLKHEKRNMIFAGLVIGVIASLLVLFGNPKNMGFCIACFLRDTAGGLGLHSAAAVQYIRPEIIGLVLGSFLMALCKKEFSARGGSAPVTRFVLGMFVMVGCLMFLGCPFRMILRLAGGDLNALLGLAGFFLFLALANRHGLASFPQNGRFFMKCSITLYTVPAGGSPAFFLTLRGKKAMIETGILRAKAR